MGFKKSLSITLLILACSLLFNLQAQTTIGSQHAPAKAALLEIKSKEAVNPTKVDDDANVTSDKGGLILSRVKLQKITSLVPFLSAADDAKETERFKHAGLVVYNINNNIATETDPEKVFKDGVYMWDGKRWSMLVREEQKFFHMPSFVLDVTSTVPNQKVDLYAQYIAQFAREGASSTYPTLVKNPGSLTTSVPNFKRSELDYFITYYDKSLLKNVSVNDNGVMTYTVDPTPPMDPYAYLSIVFVVK